MSKKSGFTLLEILIATVILTVGVVAIVWTFSTGMFASSETEDIELALGIAQAKLEAVYGQSGGVTDDSRHPVDTDGFIDPVYQNQNFEVERVTDANNPQQVDVNVYWDTKNGSASITLTTLVTR